MNNDILTKLQHIKAPDGYKWELVHDLGWFGAVSDAGTAEEVARAYATMNDLYSCTLIDLCLLQMKAEAFDEWLEKTEWVQAQQSSFPFNTLGLHRADVLRKEIERLREKLDFLQYCRLESLREDHDSYDDSDTGKPWTEVYPDKAEELRELERLYA